MAEDKKEETKTTEPHESGRQEIEAARDNAEEASKEAPNKTADEQTKADNT